MKSVQYLGTVSIKLSEVICTSGSEVFLRNAVSREGTKLFLELLGSACNVDVSPSSVVWVGIGVDTNPGITAVNNQRGSSNCHSVSGKEEHA